MELKSKFNENDKVVCLVNKKTTFESLELSPGTILVIGAIEYDKGWKYLCYDPKFSDGLLMFNSCWFQECELKDLKSAIDYFDALKNKAINDFDKITHDINKELIQ